ncbi:MAG: NifB/NifX family molybdenum-iron cluster-binding protein [Candidatus Bathyarchaeota archaeon]|nr:NifB/NifX family molybdenum-iron cluster-binding protein [Candidatus Bathyarchaeota archaeon]
MTERVVIPTEDQQGLNARLAEHFGRAPYYTIVELDDGGAVLNVKTVPNVGEHAGGAGYSHDNILTYKPTALIVYGMGPRGLMTFQSAGVAVLKANADTVNEVIAAYKNDELPELTEGCEHAHHHAEHHEHLHHH